MSVNKIRLSPVKGRNQIVITFNKKLLNDTNFVEGEYVMMICDKNKIVFAKEDQIHQILKEVSILS